MSALFLTAPEDGVAPSILLSVQDSKKKPLAQYLFNVPDGVSRLMLEHKARPGLQFKAIFLSGCSPAEAGGLGSVVLRLKQDGHASFQLVGPQGVLHSVFAGLQQVGGLTQDQSGQCDVIHVQVGWADCRAADTRPAGNLANEHIKTLQACIDVTH